MDLKIKRIVEDWAYTPVYMMEIKKKNRSTGGVGLLVKFPVQRLTDDGDAIESRSEEWEPPPPRERRGRDCGVLGSLGLWRCLRDSDEGTCLILIAWDGGMAAAPPPPIGCG